MKICVWRTGHEIADPIAGAVHEGLPGSILQSTQQCDERAIGEAEIHVCYGILRGADTVFRMAQAAGKAWFNIDKGYWKPGHYDGYYRVSLCGTQQTVGLDKLEPDYYRWDALGVDILAPCSSTGTTLVCPQTEHVKEFFGNIGWPHSTKNNHLTVKSKSDPRPIDYSMYDEVITFNSSVGWEALRQGIPVISDPIHSIVGSYQKTLDRQLNVDYEERRKLFAIMAGLQLTIEEMKQGSLWPLIQKLLSLSISG